MAPPRMSVESSINSLRSILANDDIVSRILDQDPEIFDDRQKTNLLRLHLKHGHRLDETDSDSEGSKAKKRKRSASGAESTKAATQIARLTSVELPSELAEFFARHGHDHDKFINHIDDDASKRDNIFAIGSSQSGNAFVARVRYAESINKSSALQSVRLLFTILFFYDLVRKAYPNSTGRVGSNMLVGIVDQLGTTGSFDFARTLELIREWAVQGGKLSKFCDEFGIGAIFLTSRVVTPAYLKVSFFPGGKSKVTASDYKHLHSMDLAKAAEETGMNALGQKVRDAFMEPFSMVRSDE